MRTSIHKEEPPSTTSVCPVMCFAFLEIRNSIASTIEEIFTIPKGDWFSNFLIYSSLKIWEYSIVISVEIHPGATATNRLGASSSAMPLISASNPAFETEYGTIPGSGLYAAIEETMQ